MTENTRKTPKGGSKGGTRFPRLSLNKAVEYGKKLVSKTHTGAQPAKIILPGVFGTAGPNGQVRASALKQYGLLEGSPKAYEASKLAVNINGSTPEDLPNFLKETFLTPKLFKTLFDTFCNDTVTRARIRQQASNLKVHPDSLEECVAIFTESAISAGLAKEDGDSIIFHATPTLESSDTDKEEDQPDDLPIDPPDDPESSTPDVADNDTKNDMDPDQETHINLDSQKTRANLEIKIDPSMDPEKLDKLLGVLKKYGQI